MRMVLALSSALALPALARAGDLAATGETPLPPPAYKMLRFDEDYSCLANPANRCDPLDALKYIPLLTNNPESYLTLGGELRERFEGNYDPNFGIGVARADSFLLQRITLLADLHFSERLRIYAEGISGLMEGEIPPAPPVQEDPYDLQFAFLDVIPWLNGDQRLTLRAGRFGLSLGAGRLVATRAAPNIPFRFDGFEMLYVQPGWEATGFLTQPVKDTGYLNGEDVSTTFWGLYLTHWFDGAQRIGADWYYLGIHRQNGSYASGHGDELRHSIGTREFGAWHGWDWNAEEVIQTGTFGGSTILAWTASLDAGYAWKEAPLAPRIGLKADVTSGDQNSNDGTQGTFDALFFKSGYFNDASVIRPQNIMDIHPNAAVNLTRSLSANGGVDIFWRYSRNDAVYAVPGFLAVPTLRSASSYVGTAADVNLEWRVQRHLTLQASYVHMFVSSYVEAAGGRDLDFVSTTCSFLF